VVIEKRVVKMREEILFKSPQKFFGKPKRTFPNFGNFEKFSKKKVHAKKDQMKPSSRRQ
jgi:hypothetical protein